MFEFTITATDLRSSARAGIFKTPHGSFETPCFMPCGTKGAVKTLTPEELKSLGCEILLANTYHLMLRPGVDVVRRLGGLHRFIAWEKPVLTDSGGFQVFSLSTLRKISDEGVTFRSHIDGSTHLLTPEKAIEIQEKLGADIVMAFDECPPGDADRAHAEQAMKRTHEWLIRSVKAKKRTDQALFPIIQGGAYRDLRIASATGVSEQNLPGIAIGGLAVGEPKPVMWDMIETLTPLLPKEKPRYLMGVGEPADMVKAVAAGMDMFDCVLPTRLARHGTFWTRRGRHDLMRSEYRIDEQPLEPECTCTACQHFSKSYLRHLLQEREILGHRLLTIHNLNFLLELLRKAKTAIQNGTFDTFRTNFLSHFNDKKDS